MKNSNLPKETGKTRASSSLALLQDVQPLTLTWVALCCTGSTRCDTNYTPRWHCSGLSVAGSLSQATRVTPVHSPSVQPSCQGRIFCAVVGSEVQASRQFWHVDLQQLGNTGNLTHIQTVLSFVGLQSLENLVLIKDHQGFSHAFVSYVTCVPDTQLFLLLLVCNMTWYSSSKKEKEQCHSWFYKMPIFLW